MVLEPREPASRARGHVQACELRRLRGMRRGLPRRRPQDGGRGARRRPRRPVHRLPQVREGLHVPCAGGHGGGPLHRRHHGLPGRGRRLLPHVRGRHHALRGRSAGTAGGNPFHPDGGEGPWLPHGHRDLRLRTDADHHEGRAVRRSVPVRHQADGPREAQVLDGREQRADPVQRQGAPGERIQRPRPHAPAQGRERLQGRD